MRAQVAGSTGLLGLSQVKGLETLTLSTLVRLLDKSASNPKLADLPNENGNLIDAHEPWIFSRWKARWEEVRFLDLSRGSERFYPGERMVHMEISFIIPL